MCETQHQQVAALPPRTRFSVQYQHIRRPTRTRPPPFLELFSCGEYVRPRARVLAAPTATAAVSFRRAVARQRHVWEAGGVVRMDMRQEDSRELPDRDVHLRQP